MDGKKILVIDDSAFIQATYAKMLKTNGFESIGKLTGADGIAYLKEHGADLVILDYRISDMDGSEVLIRIKEDSDICKIPVIMVSAHGVSTVVIKTLGDGADGFLTKPVQTEEFINKINEVLQKTELLFNTQETEIEEESKIENDEKKNITIAVVDDAKFLRLLLERIITKNGYTAITFEDPDDLFEYIKHNSVDLILLDYMLAETTGNIVLAKLRQSLKGSDIPVIVVSSVNELETVQELIYIGADGYLLKPVNDNLLISTIEKTLQKKSIEKTIASLEKEEFLNNYNVIIIDDDKYFRKYFVSIVEKYGFHVKDFDSCEKAMNFLSTGVADIIFINYKINNNSGLVALNRIKESNKLSHLPVVMVSEYRDVDKIGNFVKDVAQGHLLKPVDEIALIQSIFKTLTIKTKDDLLAGGQKKFTLVDVTDKKVLIIDNCVQNRIFLTKILLNEKMKVICLEKCANCVDYIESVRPDIVLMSEKQKEINIGSVVVNIRKKKHGALIPILIILSNEDIKLNDSVKDLITGYIKKPVSEKNLMMAIQTSFMKK